MPEGHTIHRLARLHRPHLVGRRVAVSSPQGRFTGGAARLDGERVDDIEAFGKHLFYHWSGDQILHVHLGLFGRFRSFARNPPAPTAGTRLALATDDVTMYLSGPTICELVTTEQRQGVVDRLGPDPLRDASPAEFDERLDRRTVPIAAALLDQKVVAGIGNVYRAEILFLAGIDPSRRARDLDGDERRDVWSITSRELRRGERAGRIVTVDPSDIGARRRSDLRGDERRYVYKRVGRPCHRCGTEIAISEIATRKIWWCPTCQPA